MFDLVRAVLGVFLGAYTPLTVYYAFPSNGGCIIIFSSGFARLAL